MSKSVFKHKWQIFALLGLINSLPFNLDFLFFLSWLLFAPFFVLAADYDKKHHFFNILLFFLFFHLGIYHFFFALVPMSFIGLSFIPSLLLMFAAWMGISAFHAVTLALPIYMISRIKFNVVAKFAAFACSIVFIQYLQSLGTYGFTWARVSLPQSFVLPLIQSSSLFGPYFVDLLLLLVNVAVASAFVTKKVTLYTSVTLILFSVNYLFGFVHMQSEGDVVGTRNVSIVQGNVLMDQKWNSASSYSVYMRETLLLDNNDSMVVWTETAIPTELNESKKIKNELEAYTVMSGNEMIVGAFYSSNVGRELNGSYYISNGKVSDNVYFKRRLVPFGEFLPFRKFLSSIPVLDDINLLSVDLYPGRSTNVFDTKGGKVGNLICFDSIFSSLARDSVNDGAELLVIITNDSWYKDHIAVYQHNNQARWRAVENGRYVVRAANSGVSSFIDSKGRIISQLPPLVQDTMTTEVEFYDDATLYTKVGDFIIFPICFYLLVLFVIQITKLPYFQRKLKKVYISSERDDS